MCVFAHMHTEMAFRVLRILLNDTDDLQGGCGLKIKRPLVQTEDCNENDTGHHCGAKNGA